MKVIRFLSAVHVIKYPFYSLVWAESGRGKKKQKAVFFTALSKRYIFVCFFGVRFQYERLFVAFVC